MIPVALLAGPQPDAVVRAAAAATWSRRDLHVLLLGDVPVLHEILLRTPHDPANLALIHGTAERALELVRRGQASSIVTPVPWPLPALRGRVLPGRRAFLLSPATEDAAAMGLRYVREELGIQRPEAVRLSPDDLSTGIGGGDLVHRPPAVIIAAPDHAALALQVLDAIADPSIQSDLSPYRLLGQTARVWEARAPTLAAVRRALDVAAGRRLD